MYIYDLWNFPIDKALISYRIIQFCCSCLGFADVNILSHLFPFMLKVIQILTLTYLTNFMTHVISYFMLVISCIDIEEIGVSAVILDLDYAHCTGHIIRS